MADETIRRKFTDWKECLEGKDPPKVDANSILGVLLTMFWEMGAYETYATVCRNNPSSPLATSLFTNLTAYNYIQAQAIRIRRLCEPPAQADEKKDTSVYSLRRVVDEMKQQRKAGFLTRDSICAAYGIPVSKEEVKRQFETDTAGVSGSFSSSSIVAMNMHAMLDKICDKNDLKKSLFDQLDKRLLVDNNAQLGEIINFVNKNIVHSASADSRGQVGREMALRIADVKKVIQDMTEAFFCCNVLVAQANTSMITIGWEDQLVNLTDEEVAIAYSVFRGIKAESETWKQNGYKLLGEPG